LGADYKKLGKRDSAIFYFEKAIKLNPNFKKAQEELADLKLAN
jgi:tetratricopeptide (TPR) repeat protein